MASFAKLWSGITESSLWGGSKEARLLFVTLLAKADSTGFVEAAPSGLARLANLTRQEIDSALLELTSPDPESKSKVAEGKRVAIVPQGVCVVNYEDYRKRRDDEERREYMREYMREYRAKHEPSVNTSKQGKPGLAQGEGEGEGEGEVELKEKPTTTVASLPQSANADSSGSLFPLPEEKPKPPKKPKKRSTVFGIAELDMPPAMASAWDRVKKAYPRIGLNTQTNRTAPRMTNPAKAGKWFKLICEECPVELGEGQRITPDDLADATLAWIKKKQKEAPGGNVPVVPCIENYFSCDPVAKLHWQSALLEYFGTSETS